MRAYTMRDVIQIVGLPRSAVMSLIVAGVVAPARGDRGEYRFSFRDLVVLRTAQALRQSNLSAGRIRRSLLRAQSLSAGYPASAMSLRAEGGDIIARAHGAEWEADSGQLRLDFTEGPTEATVVSRRGEHQGERGGLCAGQGAGGTAPRREAERAYRQAIALDPSLHAAWLDLSAMLCDQGKCEAALNVLAEP
ncbi:hypothetical protein AWV79_35495 [Cupriavidus sp. UYMMa02A]|nr:hypothetical protein AWV79_35495 [Cupriavidus sp. UYMMa02A]